MSVLRKNKSIIVVILLAALLRFSFLGSFPAFFTVDEAAKGYNAYSLIKAGKTFRGLSWPLYFTDFSDKLPNTSTFYMYSTIPFVYFFGLNETSTRLPAAITGTLTVLVLYLLTSELFKNKKIGLISATLLTLSPWHILMSRLAIEPVTFPFFFLLGWYFVERGVNKKYIYLYIGAFLLSFTVYTYNVALLITPLFIFVFVFLRRKFFMKNIRKLLIIVMLSFLITSPLINLYVTQTKLMTNHFVGLSIFVYRDIRTIIVFIAFILQKTLFPFLVFYYFFPVLVFFYSGLFKIVNIKSISSKILVSTYILVLCVSSLTFNGFSPIFSPSRSIALTGFLEIFAGYSIFYFLRKNRGKIGVYIISTALLISNLVFLYSVRYPDVLGEGQLFQRGWRDVIQKIDDLESNYDNVVLPIKNGYAFIYILFYKQYDPQKFINTNVERVYTDFGEPYEIVLGFDKYRFCELDSCFNSESNNLYITSRNELANERGFLTVVTKYGQKYRFIDNKTR